MRKWLGAILVAALMSAGSVRANTWGPDLTDLWWNPNESGWGVNVAHQGEVAFITFFIHGADNRPVWYTGIASFTNTANSAFVFSGLLFQTTAPWFAGPFNPSLTSSRQVGNVTFTTTATAGTLSYTIDGVQATKDITRQTFRNNNLTGAYTGAAVYNQGGCNPPELNGTSNRPSTVSITHTSNSFSMRLIDATTTCTYTGDYTQTGRLASSNGEYSCNEGTRGTYSIVEMEAPYQAVTGRMTAKNSFCSSISVKFAAIKN